MPRLDELGLLRVVAERLAQLLDARDQRVVAHDRAAPDFAKQLVLAHRLAGARDEQAEHARGLGRELDLALAGPQSRGRGLEAEAGESQWCVHVPANSRNSPGTRTMPVAYALRIMKKTLIFLYGVASYLVFFATFLYAVGFIGSFGVPKTLDSPRDLGLGSALAIDLGLLALF